MERTNRREFVIWTAAGALATGATLGRRVSAASASQNLQVGIIGCGGRGVTVADSFARLDGVQIRYCCDPDVERLQRAVKTFGVREAGAVNDLRKVLDDKSIDAVYIATPDHWHAPATLLACEAGKHVYVEKPCSHNVHEGRLMIEAARRHMRVVQHGTQVRSTPSIIKAMELLREGIIGEVLVAKAWNVQPRRSIGREQPSVPPAALDYDLWVGPAPMIPYQENRVHEGWHWWFHFGTGDMGNDGVHDIDYARWGLGVETHPTKVSALGGKFFFDDDQEFPDTQQVTFQYGDDRATGHPRMLIYEQRLWSRNYPSNYNCDSGAEFYGSKGRMFLSRRGKIQVIDAENRRVETSINALPQDTDAHVLDFVNAIRSDRRPNADIEVGHLTSTLVHLGNIATRLGATLDFDAANERITNNDQAQSMLSRNYREHWASPRAI